MHGMKLLVLDDHPLMLKGLAALMTQAGASVATADTPNAALRLLDSGIRVDAVLMDWKIPGTDGATTLREFVARGMTVLVVSGSVEADDVRCALAAGALGFVPKSESPESLLAAIRQVMNGIPYVPATLLREIAGLPTTPEPASLTERQRAVLRHLATGLSNKLIGRELDLSDKTVKSHVTAIFKALNVINRTQAITRARELGWLDQP
jgi:DNA-binding NarL/FixJ family response regulator